MTAVPDAKPLRSAAFILAEAQALGIKVATNGSELLALIPVQVPGDVRRWFEAKLYEHQAAVITAIQRERAARTGAAGS